jgi:phosphoglycolate phosphatase-like HAD superfamily hydrolase
MHVCLFDIDGTLLNSGGAGKAAIEAALVEEFGVTLRVEVTYSGRTDRAIGRDLLHLHGIEPTTDNWQRLVHGYLARLPASLRSNGGTVCRGIPSLLKTLSTRQGIFLGLLTGNIREGARLKLGHFDLYHFFAFGGFGDLHFERDDVAREALAAVRAHVHCDHRADRIWVIGDTPLDVRCARAIGARAVAVATGWHSIEQLRATEPDLLLPDFSDPTALLRLF